MDQITPDRFTYARVESGIIKCGCGNELHTTISLNVYRDTPKDLFSKVKAINPTDNIDILECVQCGHRSLPPILYQSLNQKDLKLARHITEMLKKWNKRNETTTPKE